MTDQLDTSALLARLERLEQDHNELMQLRQENEVLRKQVDRTGGRRQTAEEAFAEAASIRAKSRAAALPGEFEWEVYIAPHLKRNTRGKPLKYAIPLIVRTERPVKDDVFEVLRKVAGTDLDSANAKVYAKGFRPEGVDDELDIDQPELIEV